jgi:hypothetical protein
MKRLTVVALVVAIQVSGAGPARALTTNQLRHMTTVQIIDHVFPRVAAEARCIAYRESRFVATAHNPSGASGEFQLMPGWFRLPGYRPGWGLWPYRARRPFDPFWRIPNIFAAHWIYVHEGWAPWGDSC